MNALFSLNIDTLQFMFESADKLATFVHEMFDVPVDDTKRDIRELKRDTQHTVMLGNVIYSIAKVN